MTRSILLPVGNGYHKATTVVKHENYWWDGFRCLGFGYYSFYFPILKSLTKSPCYPNVKLWCTHPGQLMNLEKPKSEGADLCSVISLNYIFADSYQKLS